MVSYIWNVHKRQCEESFLILDYPFLFQYFTVQVRLWTRLNFGHASSFAGCFGCWNLQQNHVWFLWNRSRILQTCKFTLVCIVRICLRDFESIWYSVVFLYFRILESLPKVEKTGNEFLDELLSMVYMVIHTYQDKHQVQCWYVLFGLQIICHHSANVFVSTTHTVFFCLGYTSQSSLNSWSQLIDKLFYFL